MSERPESRPGTVDAYERASARGRDDAARVVLQLYVAGTCSCSVRAVANVKRICERHLAGRYRLDVVDLYQQPRVARQERIIAAPTLIKTEPAPVRRLVGDLSDERRVLAGLGIGGER